MCVCVGGGGGGGLGSIHIDDSSNMVGMRHIKIKFLKM